MLNRIKKRVSLFRLCKPTAVWTAAVLGLTALLSACGTTDRATAPVQTPGESVRTAEVSTTDQAAEVSTAGQSEEPTTTPSFSVAEETTTAPLSVSVPTAAVPRVSLSEINDARYADLSNEHNGWWYRVPDPLGQGVRAGTEEPIAERLKKYEGYWQAPDGAKTVYITSDEGYEIPGNTPKILDVAKEKNFKIHFFITGQYVRDNPDIVRRMLDEGHIVANHSQKHLNGPKEIDARGVKGLIDDIVTAEEAMQEVTGQSFAPFFRPPEGAYSERSLAVIRDLGYHAVFWSFAYRDWIQDDQPDPTEATQKVLDQLHDGSILLLHANSRTNADIMGDVVDGIRARGYEIGNLNDLLAEDLKNANLVEGAVGDGLTEPLPPETPNASAVPPNAQVALTTPVSSTARVQSGQRVLYPSTALSGQAVAQVPSVPETARTTAVSR